MKTIELITIMIISFSLGSIFGYFAKECPSCSFEPETITVTSYLLKTEYADKPCPSPGTVFIEKDCPVCYEPYYKYLMEKTAKAHEYNLETYNCYDFSTDLYYALREVGYKANISYGTFNNGTYATNHSWVELCLPIEATQGFIIDPVSYPNYYEDYYMFEKYIGPKH